MKLYFDTDAGTIVPIPGSMAALNMIKVKRADEFDVELRIYANGVQYVPDADTAWICCKNTGSIRQLSRIWRSMTGWSKRS